MNDGIFEEGEALRLTLSGWSESKVGSERW